MKSGKKIRKGLLGLAILFAVTLQMMFGSEVKAAEDYTYTITLYAGNHGVFSNGQDKLVISDLGYGDQVNLDLNLADMKPQILDDKYYAKGIRQSGTDGGGSEQSLWVDVTGDADYVIAYGIKGNQVAYTVNYQDENGNELLPSRTFYGNIGDKPVVAYQFIDGYQPQAYNLTKTLSSNEAENVFPFIYVPADTGTVTTITQAGTVTVIPATPAAGTAAAGAGTGAAAGGTAGAAGGTAGGTTETTPPADETVEVPDEETPQALQDLDDEEVPKANIDAERKTSRAPIVVGIVVGVLALAAIASTIIYLKKRGKTDLK